MKKSKVISLVLICASLASCNKPHKEEKNRLYMRCDESAQYSVVPNYWLWYYAFRPYGFYNNGSYVRSGYYSGAIHENTNIGTNSAKSGVVRGGFGRTGGFTVSS